MGSCNQAFATSSPLKQPISLTKHSIFLNPIIVITSHLTHLPVAFYMANHSLLLKMLSWLGFRDTTLSWFSSSFVGLSSVSFAGSLSSSQPPNIGCPVLGAWTFFIFSIFTYTGFIWDVICFMTLDTTYMPITPKVISNLNWLPEFQIHMSNGLLKFSTWVTKDISNLTCLKANS